MRRQHASPENASAPAISPRVWLTFDILQKQPVAFGVFLDGTEIARVAHGNFRENLIVDDSFVSGDLTPAKLGDDGRAIGRGIIHPVYDRLGPLLEDGDARWPVRIRAEPAPRKGCGMCQEIRLRSPGCDRVHGGHRFLLKSAPLEPEVSRLTALRERAQWPQALHCRFAEGRCSGSKCLRGAR